MSSAIGLGNDDETPKTAWSDPLGLYADSAPKVSGSVSYQPAQTKAAPAGGFLDQLDERDRRDIVNTVLAEAHGEGETGMAGVAAVIKNRSGIRGLSPAEVIRQPKQFTGYEAPGAEVSKSFNDPEVRANAERIINGIFSGEIADPTIGPDGKPADHYHADSVNPDWAGKMPKTAKIGRHQYYNSQPGEKAPVPAYSEVSDRSKAEEPFKAILREPPKAKGRGLADLLPDDQFEEDPQAAENFDTLLSKLQPGKPQSYITDMQPRLRTGLTAMFEAAPDFVKDGLDLLSGARSPERQAQIIADHSGKYGFDRKAWVSDVEKLGPVEAGKKWRPEFRKIGLTKNIGMPGGSKHQTGDAGDLGWKGRAFSSAPKEVRQWVHANAGNYDLTFPMAHEPWHIEHKDARNGKAAPARSQAQAKPSRTVSTVEADSSFQPSDPFGLYAGSNPIGAAIEQSATNKQAAADAEAAEKARTAEAADIATSNATAEKRLADDPSRYELVDESVAQKWQDDWKAKNQSGGRIGDTVRNFGIGAGQTSRSISNLNRLVISKLPFGDKINDTLDGIERWMGGGKTMDESSAEAIERQEATLTDRTKEALSKKAWEDGKLGSALTDPDWYLANITRSLPAMAATMGPTGIMARGAFTSALARGATQTTAAASAASTATIAGGVSEGLLGGADAALSVKEAIAEIPREKLLETDAVQAMISEGMSADDALAAVSNDVQTQAMVFAGVATGMFGGMGDRALAKIIGEGVEGSLVRRTATGAARGMVGEGIFEELPQSVGQQLSENAAMRAVDPDRDLTEGVMEAAVSGAAIGGAMGGGIGGAGGAMSRRSSEGHEASPELAAEPQPAPEMPAAAQPAPEAKTAAKGPLSRAIEHAERQAAERGGGPIGRPEKGTTVRVDADGLPPFMGVVDGYDGDEALIMDHSTGELLQVPIASLSQTGAPQATNDVAQVLPELSNDPALEPLAPMSAEIRTEVAPASQDVEATARFPGAPDPGRRVMVDDPALGRFPARVDSYENDGAEVLITNDDGLSFQVPLASVKVNGQTPAQIEAEDLKRNPPIEREIGDAGPLSRKIGKATIVLPDEKHADLYDFARDRFLAQRMNGGQQLDKDGERLQFGSRPQQQALATAFGITPEAVGAMADDYRYRVERAGKEARSALPVKMHAVEERRLKQWQAERKKLEGQEPADGGDNGHWWDVSLSAADRKQILEAAGVKRSEKLLWRNFNPAIQKKLADRRLDGPEPVATETPERTFTTAKGSTYVLHADGTTTRTKAERADPGHEGDKGEKARSNKTVFVGINAGALSAAGLNGLGSKGARVAIKYGRASLVTWNEKEGRWGVADGSRNIPITDTPAVGAYPLELWNKADDVPGYEAYSRMHAGNKITELSDNSTAKPDATTETGDLSTENDDIDAVDAEIDNDTDPDAMPAEWVARHTIPFIHKEMTKRVSPVEFVQRATTKEEIAALIEPGGKILVLNPTSNPNGDHAEFFETMRLAGHDPAPYVRLTSYGSQIGVTGGEPLSDAAAATVRAIKTVAEREGVTFLKSDLAQSIDAAANEAATSPLNDRPEPTQAQKEAGNYKVGRVSLGGMDLSIENPAGSERKGVDGDGKPWSVEMKSHYGYIRGTIGRDKDHIDVFVKPGTQDLTDASPVFVIDQNNANGKFDEHKVMLGFGDKFVAEEAYLENYTDGWNGLGSITETTLADFKRWLETGDTSETFVKSGPIIRKEKASGVTLLQSPDQAATLSIARQGNDYKVGMTSVSKNRRGEGLAVRLYEEAVKMAGEAGGVLRSDISVSTDAERVYQALGRRGYQVRQNPTATRAKNGLAGSASARGDAWVFEVSPKAETTSAPVEATAPESAPIKWFGSLQKAQAYINKNRLGSSHEVREENRRFEIHESKNRKSELMLDAASYPWADVWGSEWEAISDGLSKIANTNGGDTAISDAVKANVTDKVLLQLIQRQWGEGAASGNRYMIETRNGPIINITLEKDDGKKRVVLRGRDLSDAIRKEFAVSLDDMRRDHEAEQAKKAEPIPAKKLEMQPAKPTATPKKGKGPSTVERMENYFRPGREISGYGGATDRVVSFTRGGPAGWEVTVAEVKGDKLDRERTHSTMPSDRELARWERDNPVGSAAGKPEPQKAKPAVSENKIFTASAADAARELLRKKLNQLNSGIDPEIMQAGITLAGYHIEKGARTFAAYASAMLGDLGEVARPYLKSWYMGVKFDPRGNFDGMDGAADVEAVDVYRIQLEQANEPTELDSDGAGTLEGTPASPVQKPETSRDAGNSAERRGRADVSTGGRAGEERLSTGRSVSDGEGGVSSAAARRQRDEQPSLDLTEDGGRGESRAKKPASDVTEGPFGPILRGYEGNWREAALELERRQSGDAIGALNHPDVGPIDLVWGNAGNNDSTGAGLAKLIAWHPEVLTDLQGFIDRLSVDSDRSTKRRIQLVDETGNAGIRLDFDGTAKTWLLTAFEDGKRRSERSSRRLTDLWADRAAPASPLAQNISDQLADVQSAATPAQNRAADHVIAAEDGIGEGGAKTKFRANIGAIEILRKIAEEKRPATRQEQTALSKWVGWGGLRSAFYREDGTVTKGWEREARDLRALLTPEEYSAAESSTRNAHYTSPEIVEGIWSAVRRLGFKGGQVLEPSVGAGNFLGLMPGDVRKASRVTGVELDHITGGIAKNLYPSANIQAPLGFEKLTVPDNYFDLAIGNPPFGSERLYDKDRRNLNKFSIHNFFFAKSIDTLKPGGVLAMVVTNRFLDGNNEAARAYIAGKADLVGAIRLPNNAFLKNAGTEVTTDIIILRKREDGEAASSTAWTDVANYRGTDGKDVPLNRYFIENPEMMLGDFGAFGSMYGPDEPALVARAGVDTAKALSDAIQKLPQDVMKRPGAPIEIETVTVAEGVRDVQVGSMFNAPDGSVHIRQPDRIGEARSEPATFASETAKERVSGMVRVRDAFARLRRAQIDEKATDAQVENLRKRLNTVYDAFTAKHGPINQDVNKRLFRDDPTWPQISALEQSFDKGISSGMAKKTGEKAKAPSAAKAAIFTKRTQQPYKVPTAASSARDALALSLNLTGAIDLDLMSRLYSKSPEGILSELGSTVYKTPTGAFEPADQYLAGNVKAKLAQAEEAAKNDPDFKRNVAALRDVIPADIEAVDIDVKPGAPWVPANHIIDFINHITDAKRGTSAFYSRANAKWDLDIANPSEAAHTLWATDRARLPAILSAALNGQTITIYDKTRDSQEVNPAATEAANEKVERVKAEWGRWIWSNDARREELARLYNDTFNTDVVRVFDGSHLTLPGKVGDDVISLRPHQKAFVWRTLQSGTTLADHTVGAGKTFAAITSAMEKRRIGQAQKPMFVVPNHLVGQWAGDFIRLYPGAKVLAATKKDFDAENRKRLFARIATGDWDAVIVAHSSFGRIGINPEYEARFIGEQLEELEASIAELRQNTGERSRNIAQLTKWRDNMKSKLQRLLDAGRKDDGLTFDELGVDALYVDEAHEFKNLAFATSMTRVAGLGNPQGSQKAADLLMKSRFILERTGGQNLVFLTGTPISNTMAEMYTVQRYLDNDTLKAMGISHFDAWARVFGEVVTDWELSPSGQYKLNSRFARFVNLPELMQRYLSFADVITNDDIKRQLAAIGKTLPLPKVKGGAPAIVVVERSPDQARYIGIPKMTEDGEQYPQGSLVYRAENLPKKAEKGADNMLKVMSDARKAALDMRLIDPSYGDYHSSKIHQAADDMVRIYKTWNDKAGTQLVFIDLSTPKKAKAAEEKRIRDLMAKAEQGDDAAQETLDNMSPDEFMALESPFSVYDDLKDKLIERGIPESEIAFIHDANTDAQKEELFGKVRSGRVRFLFGSTAKMGAGTNVQNRLVALHHMDAPWRPSDLEQRDGRGIRQGNELYNEDPDTFEIEIRRYATKNTLDARQWQTIEVKAKFIQQLRKGNLKDRTIEDISGEAANAAEMKAAASGNPLILEEMEARRKLKTLQNRATEHDREQHRIKGRIRRMNEEREAIDAREQSATADAQAAAELDGKPFAAEFDGVSFDKPKEFGAAMVAAMRKAALDKSDVEATGKYGSFLISIRHEYDRAFMVAVEGATTHEVFVADAADADATGLSQRVSNTVRKLRDTPALDAERKAEIGRQLPAVEAQIGDWPQAQDLADTAALHRSLVDRLKPPPKGQQKAVAIEGDEASANVDAPVEKVPDEPVSSREGGLRSMAPPQRPAGKSIRNHATDHLRAIGRSTGHEYIMAFDDDGSVIEYGTAGVSNNTGMSNRLLSALNNATRRAVVYHNHPSDMHLSPADISYLGYPGMSSVWSIGHEGNDTRAALTPEAVARAEVMGARNSVAELSSAMTFASNAIKGHLQPLIQNKTIDFDAVNTFYWLFPLRVLERANILDIQTTKSYDTGLIEGLDALVNETAGQLAKAFYDDKQASVRRNDRQSEPLRHIAEVEGSSNQPQPPSPRSSAPGGFAERGPANNPRENSAGSRVGERKRDLRSGTAAVTQERVIDELRGKLTDLTPTLLKAIPLNYFTELAQANMTAVADYMRVKRSMDAYRGDNHAKADKLAQEWLKYTRLGFAGKDLAKAQELAELMHDTTLAGIDPTDDSKENKAKFGYDTLKRRFDALPPKGQELYVKVRDAYWEQALEQDEILLDNVRKAQQIALDRAEKRYKKKMQEIRDVGLEGLDKKNAEEDAASAYKSERTKAMYAGKARLTKLRIAFESSRVQGPYFPLARHGRYFVTVRNSEGKVISFSKFEKAADRDRAARDLAGANRIIEKGVMDNKSDMRDAMDPRMVAEIEEILGGAGVGGDIMDQIWQRYLESMPDLSTRKRQIHRKGTAGYSTDALRSFSSHMFHASHQMARMKYGLELQELVNTARDQAKEAEDVTKSVTLANELASRHDWVMNPTGSTVAQTMTSAAFVWYLASSPASAMVNLTQTLMMGAPILGSRFGGMGKAIAALGRASRDSITGKGNVANGNLTQDEKNAMDAFYQSGLIDRTQSHDLAGVGETGVRYSPLRSKVMGVISWAFHRAEVWNREVTALAAYRLARDNGANWSQAVDQAHDLTWKTHFDYSNSSRPALLQNDFAKVAMVFRQHNINMLYRIGRDIHQSLKGESAQARAEARYQLAGVVGMMSLMAGVTGTIGFNLLMGALGMAFGDDDDPLEYSERFKANVVEILGPELGGIVLNGAPGHYLGIDLSSRIGMPDLWFRSPNRELQGKEEFEYWVMQGLGASVSMVGAIVNGGFTIAEGNTARGLEMMAPKAIRDLMKAYRYNDEGLTSIRGDEIMSRDEMGVHETLAQAIGFTPAAVSERWDRNTALKNAERKIRDRRQRLINQWAMAAMSKDKEEMAEAVAGMKKFNAVPAHSGVQITKKTLESSMKTRARNAAKRDEGVLIQNKELNKALRNTLAGPIYRQED